MQGWPVYPQTPKEYLDDEYYAPSYYEPKIQYYYDSPVASASEIHGQVPYQYILDPYNHYLDEEAPKRHEERLAALPIGQETWFESDTTPRWRSNDMDDVNAAFLDNLILTQMAQDAQRRRENARAAFPPAEYEERDAEDEDVRELKALAGKPLYHVPKTVPRYEDDDYPADDGFINWNGNKRSITTEAPITSTVTPKEGEKESVMSQHFRLSDTKQNKQHKRNDIYKTITKLLKEKSTEARLTHVSLINDSI